MFWNNPVNLKDYQLLDFCDGAFVIDDIKSNKTKLHLKQTNTHVLNIQNFKTKYEQGRNIYYHRFSNEKLNFPYENNNEITIKLYDSILTVIGYTTEDKKCIRGRTFMGGIITEINIGNGSILLANGKNTYNIPINRLMEIGIVEHDKKVPKKPATHYYDTDMLVMDPIQIIEPPKERYTLDVNEFYRRKNKIKEEPIEEYVNQNIDDDIDNDIDENIEENSNIISFSNFKNKRNK